jgi:hypothetical protein
METSRSIEKNNPKRVASPSRGFLLAASSHELQQKHDFSKIEMELRASFSLQAENATHGYRSSLMASLLLIQRVIVPYILCKAQSLNPSTTLRDNSPLCRLFFQRCHPFVKIGTMVWLRRHPKINGPGTQESRHNLRRKELNDSSKISS